MVADLLNLAGIRGSPGLKQSPSQGTTNSNSSSKRTENTHRQGPRKPDGDRVIDDGSGRGGGGNRTVTDDGDVAAARHTDGASPGINGLRRAPGQGFDSGAQGGTGIDVFGAAARPTTKGRERVRPIGHPSSRQRNAASSGGGGAGESDRAAPAWEGSFRGGDADIPSADEASFYVLHTVLSVESMRKTKVGYSVHNGSITHIYRIFLKLRKVVFICLQQ